MNNNQQKSTPGGKRPGAGRPVGSTNKTTWSQVLRTLEQASGLSISEMITKGYMEAYQRGDHQMVFNYHKLILNKLAPDLHQIDMTIEANITEKQEAFAQALKDLSLRTIKDK